MAKLPKSGMKVFGAIVKKTHLQVDALKKAGCTTVYTEIGEEKGAQQRCCEARRVCRRRALDRWPQAGRPSAAPEICPAEVEIG